MRLRLLLAALLTGSLISAVPESAAAAVPERRIAYRAWTDAAGTFAEGASTDVVVRNGRLRLDSATGGDRGSWISPWVTPGFGSTEIVPSWEAATPGAARVEVEVRTRTSEQVGSWDTVARWARGDGSYRRRSGESQSDDLGRVAYDTWVAGSADGVSGWQLRVTLLRDQGGRTPVVRTLGAMASRLPAVSSVTTSAVGAAPNPALGTTLEVPRYSQMVHRGAYPEYDGGGEAWCSPTSTTMVLAYYDALPPPSAYGWVAQDQPDRVVAHLARMTYDSAFGGTGNWAFNTAYAASRTGPGGGAFVTRLRSLREAERFIAAGIPLVASVTFGSGELDGAPISSTNGHLLVVVGFTRDGDVVVNDPAAATRAGVRRTYDRGQFEDVWLRRYPASGSLRGSGGLVYVVHDAEHPLPDRGHNRNW